MWWQRPDYHNVGEIFLPKIVVFWGSSFAPAELSPAPVQCTNVVGLSVGRNSLSLQVEIWVFFLFVSPLHFPLSVGRVGPFFFYTFLVCRLPKSSACTNWSSSTETDKSTLTPKPAENLNS